jgi:hypothetical protein
VVVRAGPTPGVGAVAPPLPPQPGAALPATTDAACALQRQPANSWRLLTEETSPGAATPPPLQVVIDPWKPCLMYRAHDAQSLDRSTDGAATWQAMFHDDAAGSAGVAPNGAALPGSSAASKAFNGTGIDVPRAGELLLTEDGNGDAVVASPDAGRSWTLRSAGLAGQPVERVAVAPSNPSVAYAVVIDHTVFTQGMPASASAFTVAATADAGQSWTAAGNLPVGLSPSGRPLAPWLQVDPTTPTHVWAVVSGGMGNIAAEALVFESTDGGLVWQQVGQVGPGVPLATFRNVNVAELVATRSHAHGGAVRLLLVGSFPDDNTVEISDDGGRTWSPSHIPVNGGLAPISAVAVDPANPDRILYVSGLDGDPILYYSTDGLDTVTGVQPPRPTGGPIGGVPWSPTVEQPASTSVVQADVTGAFDIALAFDCSTTTVAPDCPDHSSRGVAYYRFVPPGAAGAGRGASGGPSLLAPVPVPMITVQPCVTPDPTLVQGGFVNALAYDGESLIYAIPGPHAAPDEVVLRMIDPRTCVALADLVVHFRPQDLQSIASLDGYRSGDTPQTGWISYDITRGALWLTFNSGSGYLFLVSLADVAGPFPKPAMSETAELRFTTGQGCTGFLSEDPVDDGLWTCYRQSSRQEVRASDGTPVKGYCDLGAMTWPTGGAIIPGSTSWTVIAPHHLLMQGTDGASFYDVDTTSCVTQNAYSHALDHPEGTADDPEASACDPLSFNPTGTPAYSGPVVWLRTGTDTSSAITAYSLPKSACRLWTDTAYAGDTSVNAGAPLQLCASLLQHRRQIAVVRRTLEFTFAGVTQASPPTSAGGRVCVSTVAPQHGGAYPVTVRFAGDSSYESSQAIGDVTVGRPPATPPATPALGGGVVPPHSGPAGGQPQPVPAPGPEAPAAPQPPPSVSQAQPQTQGQVQQQPGSAGQPAAVPGVERQKQVALATSGAAAHESDALTESLAMASLSSPAESGQPMSAVSAAFVVAASVAVVAGGWVVRAPAVARAKVRRSRRRPRAR